MSIDKKAILYWCDSVEKEFESLNAVIGGDKIVPKKFLDTSIQYLRALCEEEKILYGIAYTVDGSPTGKIASWNPATWNKLSDALEGCEADGWRGYVCQYPCGYRPVGGWENA